MEKVYRIYDKDMVLRAEVKVNGISVIDLVQQMACGIPESQLYYVTPNGMIRLEVSPYKFPGEPPEVKM